MSHSASLDTVAGGSAVAVERQPEPVHPDEIPEAVLLAVEEALRPSLAALVAAERERDGRLPWRLLALMEPADRWGRGWPPAWRMAVCALAGLLLGAAGREILPVGGALLAGMLLALLSLGLFARLLWRERRGRDPLGALLRAVVREWHAVLWREALVLAGMPVLWGVLLGAPWWLLGPTVVGAVVLADVQRSGATAAAAVLRHRWRRLRRLAAGAESDEWVAELLGGMIEELAVWMIERRWRDRAPAPAVAQRLLQDPRRTVRLATMRVLGRSRP